jgi:DNA-binding response OmpR family regulator
VLILGDAPASDLRLAECLHDAGFLVRGANTVAAAVRVLANVPVDAVLVTGPGAVAHGAALLRHSREDLRMAALPIVVLGRTAGGHPADPLPAFVTGWVDADACAHEVIRSVRSACTGDPSNALTPAE